MPADLCGAQPGALLLQLCAGMITSAEMDESIMLG
jgi:hypothetical protein